MLYTDYAKLWVAGTLVATWQIQDAWSPSTVLDNVTNPGVGDGIATGTSSDLPVIRPDATTVLDKNLQGVFTTPFQSTLVLPGSPNAEGAGDFASDVTGSAEGTAFTSLPSPSSGLPGYGFISSLTEQDYDPVCAGTQTLPIGFIYLLIMGVVLIITMLGVMIFTRSVAMVLVAGRAIAMLLVSVGVVSPWFLMWIAVPGALWLLVNGRLPV